MPDRAGSGTDASIVPTLVPSHAAKVPLVERHAPIAVAAPSKASEGKVIASPQQLSIVAQILEAYSIAFAVDDPARRENMAELLMKLFERGARTQAELAAAIEREIARGFLR